MQKAQNLFDSRLESTAILIASANSRQVGQETVTNQQTPYTFFQIIDDNGQLLTRSENAPDKVLGELEQGFHIINFGSYRWRNYVYRDTVLQRWVIVAERIDIRYMLAEDVVMESLLPIVMAIPVAALIIWFAVGIGLKPLNAFASQLSERRADDLRPIELERVPKELTTVVNNTNSLLLRLAEAFDREQRFSADAAHELRTPVSVLKVHLHNLRTRLGKDDEDIILLRDGVERMGHLIEQILALYRTSPDQAAVKFEHVDLFKMVQEIIARGYDAFESKQQEIELDGESHIIEGNVFALETLISNLLNNANKYTPEKGQIHAVVRRHEEGVLLRVEDSGPGIPEDQYQRVFERFYRLHGDQHNSGVVGCGLGLTIVKHIADLHHASIQLGTSAWGHGLRVDVIFPLRAVNYA
ncbi:ATP-binding protein [Methylophaga sulfidovorans]